ncbi:MAG: N-6 DNA methylase, partial [Deltaproteobacteria bacterium]|nr:N-6 DNA methylase [Deltaproteobacteria bacterium]
MPPLEKNQRAHLERTIKEARQIAEDGARIVLEHLSVGERVPASHLNMKELDLRNKCLIHGRQLGNVQDTTSGGQEIDLLIEEVAYEHWHRMLFARFLSENNLLMYPDPEVPVPITLEECEELAPKNGATNGFELAARFATRMLPQIFRTDSPVFELTFPPESTQKLERLLSELPKKIFKASDSLGWVYQFWQTAKKLEVYSKEIKIGPRELPAVTQIFTDPYLVNFLLDNSLGAWWAGKRLTPEDFKGARNEEELRQKVALPGMPLEYLRFAKQEDGTFRPAAGFFSSWPEKISDLKILDPCCGSGHFLVAAFLMLVPLRMEMERLSARDAVDAILRENIYGLELDRRCLELAAFALSITSWKYKNAGGYRCLPELNLACSGLSFRLSQEELNKFNFKDKNLNLALNEMLETFKEAPLLGSLLDPTNTPASDLITWNELKDILGQILKEEQNEERKEAILVAHGLAKAANNLKGKYHLVITNVPYLSHSKENLRLKEYCKKHYPDSYRDLSTVFLERCLNFCGSDGVASVVLPQKLLFLSTYKNLRENLIRHNTLRFIAKLGHRAFVTIDGEIVQAILFFISPGRTTNYPNNLFGKTNAGPLIHGINVSEGRTAALKAELIKTTEIWTISQDKQLENPDSIIGLEERTIKTLLNNYAKCLQGIATGDDPHFRRRFWELPKISGECV